MRSWLRRLLARLGHRHDWELRIDPGRMYLQCVTCPAQSPGLDLADTMADATWSCRVCHRAYAKDQPDRVCADCRRLQAYGVLVDACVGNGFGYDVLDAIATLMGTTTRLRRQHSRELMDEQRGAQRDAREAYHDGLDHGRQEGRSW